MNTIENKLDRIIFLLEELNRKMSNTGVRYPCIRHGSVVKSPIIK